MTRKARPQPKRGDIYLINFDPTVAISLGLVGLDV